MRHLVNTATYMLHTSATPSATAFFWLSLRLRIILDAKVVAFSIVADALLAKRFHLLHQLSGLLAGVIVWPTEVASGWVVMMNVD